MFVVSVEEEAYLSYTFYYQEKKTSVWDVNILTANICVIELDSVLPA